MEEQTKQQNSEKVIIIGSGPAGWTAAIYASRANLQPLIFEGHMPGGQLMLTTKMENYPGFKDGVNGPELVMEMRQQAINLGTRVISEKVDFITKKNNLFEIKYSDKTAQAKTVIIATGASARWLNIPSEAKFRGKGVGTCATCDGFFYKNKNVIIVGGGDSAMEEARFLSKIAKNVKILVRGETLRASPKSVDMVKKQENIEFIWNTSIIEYQGKNFLESVKVQNSKTNNIYEIKVDGVFLAIGNDPNVECIDSKLVDLYKDNYIKTENTKTKTPGLFAAGDVQDPIYKQAITSAGSGCIAALEAQKYMKNTE